jgi:hypothetical protein
MAKKKIEAISFTLDRVARFARILRLIERAPRDRDDIMKVLALHRRAFYRDISALRELNIDIRNDGNRFFLGENVAVARAKLPCPDPQLTMAELAELARGTSALHRKLKKLLVAVVGSATAANNFHKG